MPVDHVSAFLHTHAGYHAGDVSGEASTLTDQVFGGLTDAQMRVRPLARLNSLVWVLWHMARIEDVAVNLVIAAAPQVLDEAWARRMNVDARHHGSGMTDAEVDDLTMNADIDGVRAYRSAVGRRTREVVRALPSDAWDEIIGLEDLARAAVTGAFHVRDQYDGYRPAPGERVEDAVRWFAARSRKFPWQDRSRWQQLASSAAGHMILHHGEAITIRGLGGFGL
jgi:hypothetical protein